MLSPCLQALAKVLKACTSLRDVNLAMNDFGDKEAQASDRAQISNGHWVNSLVLVYAGLLLKIVVQSNHPEHQFLIWRCFIQGVS